MSFKAVDWAIEQRIKSGPKLTLICIASFADDDGVSFPSQETLAAMISDDTDTDARRTVIRHIQYLSEKGLLSVSKTRTGDGQYERNEYQLQAPIARLSYGKPSDKMSPGKPATMRQIVTRPSDILCKNQVTNCHINQSVESVIVNTTPPKGGVADAASPPAPAARKPAASKPAQTTADVALQAECNRVYDAIVSEHALTKGDCIQLRSNLKPFVQKYGADDVLAWHRAACRAKDGNYVPISFASRGINGWLAAGRPDVEPDPFRRNSTNGRNAAPSAVVSASKKYGDNEHYARLEREHQEWLRSIGEAV